jgi:hypothetical protein
MPAAHCETPTDAAVRLVRLLEFRGLIDHTSRVQTTLHQAGLDAVLDCETALAAAWPGAQPEHELVWALPASSLGQSGFVMAAYDAVGRLLACADGQDADLGRLKPAEARRA